MEEKTVIEWLEQAKADGRDWADAAIKNTDTPDAVQRSLSKALAAAFVWKLSPEGSDYWIKVHS